MPKGFYRRIKPAWNKGLTKETDIRVKKYSKSNIGKHNMMKGRKRFEKRQRIRAS